MAIKPEDFTGDHMAGLIRGMKVAEQALALAKKQCDIETKRAASLLADLDELRDSLADRPTTEDWTKLTDKIFDCQRGVISTHELYIYAKENQ